MINGLINEPEVNVYEVINKVKSKDTNVIDSFSKPRPPSVNSVVKSGGTSKANGFPEISVWVPTTTKPGHRHNQPTSTVATTSTSSTMMNGPTYTMASTNSKPATSSSTASTATATPKALEYSPFGSGSTLNVWQQRALLQQKKRTDFASVAAAGLNSNASISQSSNSNVKSTSISAAKASKQMATPPTPEDLSKAPGYRQAKGSIMDRQMASRNQRGNQVVSSPDCRPNVDTALIFTRNCMAQNQSSQSTSPILDEAAQKIAAAAAMNQSNTPPSNSQIYYPSGNIDLAAMEETAVTDLSTYFSALGTPKTSYSSPTSYSRPQTQRNSLGFETVGVGQLASGVYEQDSGRRSAGAPPAYFSPVALPRPASATASVNLNGEQFSSFFKRVWARKNSCGF